MNTPSGTAVAYVRVSTGKQVRSGLGLDAQKAAITAYTKLHGLAIAKEHWFIEKAQSGSDGDTDDEIRDRPQLAAALGSLTKGAVLVVAKRDRMARDVLLAAWLNKEAKRRGASIASCAGEGDDTTPAGQLLSHVIDAFAQFERARLRERITDAMDQARKQGRRISRHIPYGMRLGPEGLLVKCESEQRVVCRVLAMRREGRTFADMTSGLVAEGLHPRQGTRWHDTQLRRILQRHSKPKKDPYEPTGTERNGHRDRDPEAGDQPRPEQHGAAAGGPGPGGRKGRGAQA